MKNTSTPAIPISTCFSFCHTGTLRLTKNKKTGEQRQERILVALEPLSLKHIAEILRHPELWDTVQFDALEESRDFLA